MIRIIVAVLVVAGLALGIWFLWPGGDTASDTATTVAASPTTTTTGQDVPTTTLWAETTTLSIADSHVVKTVEEAEEILRELWFGWFEGIYNQDEDRIREVVANPDLVEAGIGQFDVMQFKLQPTKELLSILETEILLSNERCLAAWALIDATAIVNGSNDGVHIFLFADSGWVFVSQWASKGDLWESDCDSLLFSSP